MTPRTVRALALASSAFLNGNRTNDPGKLMTSVVERLDDADIAAVAAYFPGKLGGKASLRVVAASYLLSTNGTHMLPSQADELITVRLKEALAFVDTRLLEHLIVGDTISSMAEMGLL